MGSALTVGVLAAAGAAVLYNLAPLLQALAARRSTPGKALGLGLLGRLVRRPLWLAGLGAEIGGFLLEVVALGAAPFVLVQPVIAAGVVVLVVGGAWILDERLSRRGVSGVVAIAGAGGLLAVAFRSGAQLGTPATDGEQVGAAAVAVAIVVSLLVVAARRRRPAALALATAAGVLYGVASISTRQVGLVLDPLTGAAVRHLLASPAPYLLAVLSIGAIGLLQRALQAGAAVVVFPVLTGVSALVPIVLGVAMLQERIDAPGPFAVALALLALGLIAVSREPAITLAASPG